MQLIIILKIYTPIQIQIIKYKNPSNLSYLKN